MTRAIVTGVALLLLQGCSIFTPPKANPVIEDRITHWFDHKKIGVLATTPERRVFVVKMPDNHFCAEPSPDAADNVSAALTAMVQGSIEGRVTDAQLSLAQTLTTSAKQLFQRSQGVQLYRDGSFMLCNAYLNGAIDDKGLWEQHQKLLDVVKPLIEKELEYLHKTAPDDGTPTKETKKTSKK